MKKPPRYECNVARGFVAQAPPAVFGGADQMNVNGGKGLCNPVGRLHRFAHLDPTKRSFGEEMEKLRAAG